MFTIWDVTARPAHYDWQSVAPVPHTPRAGEWDENLRNPGEDHGARVEEQPPRRARAAIDPYKKALERQSREARQSVRTAADLMTSPVVFLTPDDSVAVAWDLVRDRRFRHVPILSGFEEGEQQRLVGIISDRDLLRVAGTPEYRPTDNVGERTLRTLMRSPVFSAYEDTPVREVARVMFHEHIGAMPICDKSGNLVGMLTRSDVLRSLLADGPLNLWI